MFFLSPQELATHQRASLAKILRPHYPNLLIFLDLCSCLANRARAVSSTCKWTSNRITSLDCHPVCLINIMFVWKNPKLSLIVSRSTLSPFNSIFSQHLEAFYKNLSFKFLPETRNLKSLEWLWGLLAAQAAVSAPSSCYVLCRDLLGFLVHKRSHSFLLSHFCCCNAEWQVSPDLHSVHGLLSHGFRTSQDTCIWAVCPPQVEGFWMQNLALSCSAPALLYWC